MKTRPLYLDCLIELEKEIISKLNRGYLDKKSPFNLFVLSTLSENNVNSRIVVLRNFCSVRWEILIHSDLRSKKISELQLNKKVCLNFWDPKTNFQIRVRGEAEKDELNIEKVWNKLSNWSKRNYLSKKTPGKFTKKGISGFDEDFLNNPPDQKHSSEGKKNFCQIKIFIKSIDCLILNRLGYRRALFQNKFNKMDRRWLMP